MLNKNNFTRKLEEVKNLSAEESLIWGIENYRDGIVFSSSLGLEDQIITDIMHKNKLNIQIITLDTGRLFQETYELLEETERKYGIKIKVLFPDHKEVEEYVGTYGINGFYSSIENRKKCCYARKISPLKKELQNKSMWICGLRKQQSVTRENMEKIEWDHNFELLKLSPLLEWDDDDIWKYIEANNVPYNRLHKQGYPSIGCACCTRSVRERSHVRDGRWWWESPEHKECGLHFLNGKVYRNIQN